MNPLPPAPSAPPVSPEAPYTIPSYTFPQPIYQTPQTYSYPQTIAIATPLQCQQCNGYDTYVTKYTFPCGKVHQVHQHCVPPYNPMCMICLKFASQQVFVENTVIPKSPSIIHQSPQANEEGIFQKHKKKIIKIFILIIVISVFVIVSTIITSRRTT